MHDFAILQDLVVILLVAVVVVVVLTRARVPALAGFVLAGVLVGPHGLGLVDDAHEVELLAEVGVVLLLFGIGLELSLDRIRRLWRAILLGGSLQVGLTAAITGALAVAGGLEPRQAVFLGCVISVSSTAIVLRGLSARGELDAPHGRLALGILIFQDLCVVPMMLVIPLLAGQGGSGAEALGRLGTAVGVLAAVLLGSRLLVPRLLAHVSRSRQRDLFILSVFLICIGTAWLSSLAGISLALGAFLGGLIVAGSEYRHQALADLIPARDVLASVFFVSIGMLLDLEAAAARAGMILGLLGAILLGKFLVILATTSIMRLPLRVSILTGAALAQVGEFSFVLLSSARSTSLVPEPLGSSLLVAIILSMAITPFILAFGPHLAAGAGRMTWLNRLLQVQTPEQAAREHALRDHVVVAGYGLTGRTLAHALREAGTAFIVVDLNPANVRAAAAAGHPACFGDITSSEVLRELGIGEARRFVVAVNDPDAVERSVRIARALAPGLTILARTSYESDAARILTAGADQVVAAEVEAAAGMRDRVLELEAGSG
jgi:CPA2 family monovalent cation:H+ antiporter-2